MTRVDTAEARRERVKDIFFAALEQPDAERRRFIGSACGDDAVLRQEVESLIEHHQPSERLAPDAGNGSGAKADGRATVFRRPAARSESASGTGFGLPADLLGKSRRRLEVVAWLVVTASLADLAAMAVSVVFGPATATIAATMTSWPFVSNLFHVAMSAGVIVAARSPAVRNVRLLDLALAYEVALCLTLSLTNPLVFYRETGALPTLTWVTPLIILFPLIVPCPPRRTLLGAGLAAATAPLGLWALEAMGEVQADASAFLSVSFGPVLAVVMAYFGSRVIYGLGREVAEAQRMGSYQLERLLGAGGMGEVWLGRHRLLARPAAVKLVRADVLGASAEEHARALQRFEREAQSTASLCSPHTVGLYDFGIASDGAFYYVMELLDGCNADVLVRRFGPQPPERVVHLLRQVCHSLAEAHGRGLVHRDIKPANLFVCRYGRDVDFVKVLDFGLVKRIGGSPQADLTAQNLVFGTPAFMAPEQALEQRRDDPRLDLYAVGCVAYFLLTGQPVFDGRSPLSVLLAHQQAAPMPPSTRVETPIPPALDRLVLSCLAKNPLERPQSAVALDEALALSGASPAWTPERASRWWADHMPETAD